MNEPGSASRARVGEHVFADDAALAAALAGRVAANLREAIFARGSASLAVSGGTTPRRFFRSLGVADLDWPRVAITLVDERWVPAASERSNAKLVADALLAGAASAARFIPLYAATETPEQALDAVERRLDELALPLDVAVLGMGADAHTASYFPDADLRAALDPATPRRVAAIRAASAGEPRITLTLPLLASARALYLQIEGAAKRRVYDAVVRGDDAFVRSPIRTVLDSAHAPAQVYWCP